MQKRKNISSGTKWEDFVGYSRAVRVGNMIFVSGTTAVGETGKITGEENIYLQAKFIFQKIENALKEAGANMNQVVRTRMFVTDISKWEEVAKAHVEFFKEIKPAATMVEIKSLIDPKLLIEIEVDAVMED